ncbi:CocE/NonD family hydrolase [Streptomyces sp. C10-9-1]|uniref:CocE/NonD family hydrolase n=1 Tax=Streptomyces sp. C10-9-1 TaxID=1859285 RepID=UPI003D74474D
MRIRTDFPHEVLVEDARVPLPDGIALHARIWRPVDAGPVPAVLEYAPDRLTDASAVRDGERHPWYAGHGYACVRVDARGHGSGGGVPGPGGGAGEVADGRAVVGWLAARPWCTGRVGMIGLGSAAATALRVAAPAPAPLRAVVAVCPSGAPGAPGEEPLGGAGAAQGLLAEVSEGLAHAARPPDPRHCEGDWRALWETRLEALRPPWRTAPGTGPTDTGGTGTGGTGTGAADTGGTGTGSADTGAGGSPVTAAVLAVGSLHGPGSGTVLRLVEELPPDRVRGLLGAWQHQYPDRAEDPAEAVGFLQETLRWWDHWLRGRDTGVLTGPLLRWRLGGAGPEGARWAASEQWPSPRVAEVRWALGGGPVAVASPLHTGVDAGRHRPVGHAGDLPPDQREEDARSVCFEFPVGAEPVVVLGRPRVVLRLTGIAPGAPVAARLCDVAPDGTSALVARGALRLPAAGPGGAGGAHGDGGPDGDGGAHGPRRAGGEGGTAGPGGVVVALTPAAHRFAPGHRVRLAVSGAYWPWLWPAPGPVDLVLDPAGSGLVLPVHGAPQADRGDAALPGAPAAEPEHAAPPLVSVSGTLDPPPSRLLVTRDVPAGTWTVEAVPHRGRPHVHPDGLEYTEEARESYTVEDSDPLSARARSVHTIRLHRPETAWDVRVEVRSELRCDGADHLAASAELVCLDGREAVFHRTWEERLPRGPYPLPRPPD